MMDTSTDLFNSASDVEPVAGSFERAHTDRRNKPTSMMSRYWLRGRRGRGGRRDGDDPHVYVDRYTRMETAVILWLLFASLTDLGLTLLHISDGGGEANPIMNWFLIRVGAAGSTRGAGGIRAAPRRGNTRSHP